MTLMPATRNTFPSTLSVKLSHCMHVYLNDRPTCTFHHLQMCLAFAMLPLYIIAVTISAFYILPQ